MNKRKTLSRLIALLKSRMPLLILSLAFTAAGAALDLFVPIIIGRAVDCMPLAGDVDFEGLMRILVQFAVLVLVTGLCRYLAGLANNRLAYTVVNDLRCRAFAHLQKVPFSALDGLSTGDTMSRLITDVDQFSDGLLSGLTKILRSGMSVIGTLIIMFTKSVPVALAVVCLSPLSLLTSFGIAKFTYRFFKELAADRGALFSFSEDLMNGSRETRCFNYADDAEARYGELNETMRRAGTKAVFLSSLTNPVTRFVNSSIYALVAAVGGFMAVVRGTLSIGDLTALLNYCNRFTKPINEFSSVITDLQNSLSSLERVFELLDLPVQDEEGEAALSAPRGDVAIRNLSFSYTPEQELMRGLNLEVEAGSRVAIVGPTGSGKTTLINLLMRFYEPNEGEITLDGIPLAEIPRDRLRSSFGMVLQNTWLSAGTVAENIAYGRPDATRDEIIAAAKRVHADSFIKRLPKGYDTVLGEDGAGLSEGQRQLLCVARVMLLDPAILLLDEATSSIDTLTEKQVQRAFAESMKGRTSFVVAHRLSTVRDADLILVMKDGDVIEQGTHEALIARGGFYKEMFESQYGMN